VPDMRNSFALRQDLRREVTEVMEVQGSAARAPKQRVERWTGCDGRETVGQALPERSGG
jgi:hypothetical protein